MTLTQNITLDVARETALHIAGKQFDENSRFLLVTIKEAGEEKSVPAGSTITLNARRPDGSAQSFAGSIQDGKAFVEIDQWILEQYGTVYCSISVVDSEAAKLTTLSFRLLVERAEGSGFVLVYVAAANLPAGTYYITMAGVNYSFTTTQAVPAGGKIYFSSIGTTGKTTNNGATIEDLTLTAGSTGTELQGSDIVNFLTQMQANVAAIDGELDSKADKSAIEENLAAGTSLATIDKDSYTPSTTPYLHRISPSGKRCEYDVIGGTVGWNQLWGQTKTSRSARGITIEYDEATDDIVVTVENPTGYLQYVSAISSKLDSTHKYLLESSAPLASGMEYYSTGFYGLRGNMQAAIQVANAAPSEPSIYLFVGQNTANGTYRYKLKWVDLTTLLGSTIANYAYQLEQTTAGSGIAWLKSFGFLTKSYYPFCEPTLESVQATARKAVGKNLFGETQLNYRVNATTGEIESASNTNWISNRIGVFGKPYTVTLFNKGGMTNGSINIARYKADGNFKDYVSFAFFNSAAPFTHTYTETDVYSIIIYGYQGGGATAINTAQMQVEFGSTATTYQPYESHTYLLDSSLTLRGIPKLDSSNNIYYDGDVYKADGSVQRRYGVVDLGTLTWTKASIDGNAYYSDIISDAMAVGNVTTANVLCAKYDLYMSGNGSVLLDKTYRFGGTYSGTKRVTIRDDAYTSASAFKAAMSGIYLVYELATPTTESADPFIPIQYTGSTEAFTTSNDVPVGVEGKYYDEPYYSQTEVNEMLPRMILSYTKGVPYNKTALVDLGTLNWTFLSGKFYADLPLAVSNTSTSAIPNLVCSKYVSASLSAVVGMTTKGITLGMTGYWGEHKVGVYDDSYTDIATFKQAMSGVLLAYETT